MGGGKKEGRKERRVRGDRGKGQEFNSFYTRKKLNTQIGKRGKKSEFKEREREIEREIH